MTWSQDAIRLYEQDLLQKADMLAIGLKGLRAADAARAAQLLDAITERLEGAALRETPAVYPVEQGGERQRPLLVATRGEREDIEDFILDILAENPLGLSVQEIVDHLDEAQLDMKRRTLVVRLHRMVHAGKLASRAHGHYALSEAERTRRRA
ncbi:MAG TPA: hypothetical protein VE909_01010 [Xanthobacteraceae bacterium]|nr:hypothetical protein [Stellaceae bacterium]HYW59072.1 hypothetical protein [Xanthobacteraceae bacterium]